MIKKLLIPALITMLAFASAFTCVHAEETNDDFELLYHLDILGEEYANYQSINNITEKEFLKILTGFITDDDISAEEAYNFALSQNMISRTDHIELDSSISYERALSLSLNVLGYAGIVEFDGRDISAVMKFAHENKLTKGMDLQVGDKLNAGNMIKLLVNTLDAKVINVGIEQSGVSYKKGDKNPLEAHRDIEKITAKLTQTADTSIYKESGAGDGMIGLDDNTYYISYDYPIELLGQTVYAYIRDDEVFHVMPRYKDLKTLEIDDEDIVDISDNFLSLTYDENDKTKLVNLDPALIVIYNGKNYTGYSKEDLMPETGRIVLVDTDRDNKYNMFFVYSYETMVVKSVSPVYKIIENAYDAPDSVKTLDLSDPDIELHLIEGGKEVTFSSIQVNSVLNIAHAKGDDKVITVYISKEKINGTAKRVYSEDGKTSVTVNDADYELDRTYSNVLGFEKTGLEKIKIGNVYDFYLDAFGKIAFAKSDSLGGYEYVFLFKLYWDDDEDTAGMRFLNTDGIWEKALFPEKLTYNDERKEAEFVFNEFGGNEPDPQTVLIKRDADGKIKALKTAVLSNKYEPNKFTKTSQNIRYYWNGDSSFNCRHYLKYDAIVFIRPKDGEDITNEDLYDCVSISYFKDWRKYTYVAFNVDEFGYPDVFEVKGAVGASSTTFYVNNVSTMLDEDDQPVLTLTGNCNSIENLQIREKPGAVTTNVQRGDVVSVHLANGKINDLTVVCSAENLTRDYMAPPDDSGVHDSELVLSGDVLGVDPERRMLKIDCQVEQLPIYVKGGADIEIYDKEKQKFIVGSIEDIYKGNYVRIEMGNNSVISVVVIQ